MSFFCLCLHPRGIAPLLLDQSWPKQHLDPTSAEQLLCPWPQCINPGKLNKHFSQQGVWSWLMSERNGDLWLQTDSSRMEKQMSIWWKQYNYLYIMQFLERRHLFTTSCLCEEIEMQTRNIIKNWRQTSTQKVSSNLTLVTKGAHAPMWAIGCRPLPAKCHHTLPFYPEASSLPFRFLLQEIYDDLCKVAPTRIHWQ